MLIRPAVPGVAPTVHDPVRRVAIGQAAVGFAINSIGASLVLLARDLGREPEALAGLAASFGAGLLIVGAVGPVLLRRGAGSVIRLAALVTAAGAAVLATGSTAAVAATGAVLLGTGSAGVVLATPALLAGPAAAAQLCVVNAIASVCGMLGPLAIGLLDLGFGHGRLALLLVVPPLLVLAVLAPAAPPAPPPVRTASGGPRPHSVAVAWGAVVLGVSIEFCFAIWAAARLQQTGLGAGTAASVAVAFLLGMAVTRFVAPALIGRGVPVVPVGCALVVAGTVGVALPGTGAVVAGLVVAGIGTAVLYPVTVARLVGLPGLSIAHGTSLGAVASGTAITVAPVVLAALGAALDLRAAYLIAVLPLAAALMVATRTGRDGRASPPRRRATPAP
ncbi:MAG: hypothetical protein AB7J32_00160 [Pseudonocardia sp.]